MSRNAEQTRVGPYGIIGFDSIIQGFGRESICGGERVVSGPVDEASSNGPGSARSSFERFLYSLRQKWIVAEPHTAREPCDGIGDCRTDRRQADLADA